MYSPSTMARAQVVDSSRQTVADNRIDLGTIRVIP